MQSLGKIVRLQIQRSSLKRDLAGHRVYDPAPLLQVDALMLTRTGACARTADGSFILDVHNTAHPHTRFSGANPLSFGFTSHYTSMQARFGPHLSSGCAGENILIETNDPIAPDRVAGGISIETPQGLVTLEKVIVAAPCRPFSTYALANPGAETPDLKAALQFLDQGMRGYYCAFGAEVSAEIFIGATVFAV